MSLCDHISNNVPHSETGKLQIVASASGQELNKRIDPHIDPKDF